MDTKKIMSEEEIENAAGGAIRPVSPIQNSNFCPRCRSPKYRVVEVNGAVEIRVCEVCGQEYPHRKY